MGEGDFNILLYFEHAKKCMNKKTLCLCHPDSAHSHSAMLIAEALNFLNRTKITNRNR